MKKNKLYMILVLMFFSVLFIGNPHSVKAANPQVVKLKTNKTYKKYDITGDRKNDTLKIKISKHSTYGYYNSLAVVINGKTAYSFNNKYFYANSPYNEVDIRLYTLKNGKPFLFLYAQAENGDGPVCGVFQYKSGKLKQIINFQTLFQGYGSHLSGDVISINGNKITTEYYIMSYVLGPCSVKYNYTYKNGTLKRTSNVTKFDGIYSYGKDTRIFYANKKLTAYTATNAKTKAFTVKKGTAVQVDKCYCNGKSMLVRVKYKGKYGWIKAAKGYPGESNKQFSNVTYAG
ncbi:hypothetical protein [Ruminococcus sp. 5_1_39BFAA]|uniref:hypothetical protein n=1 Tax=Ruminococcus sp. 5_1_39BFAA TaxID=457412 RepID=UPI003568C288